MTDQARSEVIAAYRSRRSVLLDEAAEDERRNRPISSARKRQAARVISRAVSDEVVDEQPSGLLRPDIASHDDDVREGWR